MGAGGKARGRPGRPCKLTASQIEEVKAAFHALQRAKLERLRLEALYKIRPAEFMRYGMGLVGVKPREDASGG